MEDAIRERHSDLKCKYGLHGTRIEKIWCGLNQKQRVQAIKAGQYKGQVLEHAEDERLGNVCLIVPEWNLRDMTPPSSRSLLDIMKHRATTSLLDQYMEGVNGGFGDCQQIMWARKAKGLRHATEQKLGNSYTMFISEDDYGKSIDVREDKKAEILAELRPAMQAQLLIPRAIGELVLSRQQTILESLNIVIEDILDIGSTTRTRTKRPEDPSAAAATAALARMSVNEQPKNLGISDLVEIAQDQKSSLEDGLQVLLTEPSVLAHDVNFWFFTRPEFVADERGRSLTVASDRYISHAVFDAVQSKIKEAAKWLYISGLLEIYKEYPHERFGGVIRQELANVCHSEYLRAQSMLKRCLSTGSGGSKWFQRASNVRKDGIVRLSMKRSPEALTVENPQLHYMLRLCRDETKWTEGADWLQKLQSLHRAHPMEVEDITEREFGALGELAVIVTFLQSLSSIMKLPGATKMKGESFLSRYEDLDSELRELKAELDLRNFATPIDNLLGPGMAIGALTTLDQYIVGKTGTKLGFLYEDLTSESLKMITKQVQRVVEDTGKSSEEYVSPITTEPKLRIEERRKKEKTRPEKPSMYELVPEDAAIEGFEEQHQAPQQVWEVKPSTHDVLTSLMSRNTEARGKLRWDDFIAAMLDIGFSINANRGSIYTFIPPARMAVTRKLTLHRPHQSSIEGRHLLIYSFRLKKVYGWTASTFTVRQ